MRASGAPDRVHTGDTPRSRRSASIDPSAAAAIDARFRAAEALERFRHVHAPAQPTIAQLWPEYFDVAISMGEVNYGCSPGDDGHESGYAYVGLWNRDGLTGDFWNEPFGASRRSSDLGSASWWPSSRPGSASSRDPATSL